MGTIGGTGGRVVCRRQRMGGSEKDTTQVERPYYRRDQKDGVSPPDLTKKCTYADHIVHARGKRTRFTSVSLDLSKIRDFGEASYRLKRREAEADSHKV